MLGFKKEVEALLSRILLARSLKRTVSDSKRVKTDIIYHENEKKSLIYGIYVNNHSRVCETYLWSSVNCESST